MTDISRAVLFGKLNSVAYKAVEGATVFCKLRGNPFVEIEHWIAQLVQQQDSDWNHVFKHFAVDPGALAKDLTAALDRLPRGATSISDLSDNLTNSVERAWVYSSLKYGQTKIRTAHLLLGMLKTSYLKNALFGISRQFEKIRVDDLAADLDSICANSPESQAQESADNYENAAPGEASGAMAPAALGKQEALKRFTLDLTEKAKKGEIDPVTGRDDEIRQIVDILMRRRQNNPILTGEAGVGKTAVVEGFALRIARGDIPPALKDVSLLSLDLGLLQAGASMKGEFEQRLRQVIDEVQASSKPIILFIDEIHTLVGAGGAAGTGDAANLLKPALARGNLRTIGATTWAEYKKYIEKDPALTRRFQVVQVPEPDEAKGILMLRGIVGTLEKHHRVQLLDSAVEAAVKLSHRYIPARQLPDKAVSLLDTACARVAISQHAIPAELESCQRRIEALNVELEIIGREESIGLDVAERRNQAQTSKAEAQDQLAVFQERWESEKALVDDLLSLRSQLRDSSEGTTEEQRTELTRSLRDAENKLRELQGESPLIFPQVDEQTVASVVADWTGIPVGRMVKNEVENVLNLAQSLSKRIIGQDHALEMIAKRIQTSRAKLDNPNKPVGVFMLAGTSGVGKTETALALAELLYGGEQNLITINMSEYQEAHTVSTLKGAPPGYVGYGEGGVLTEAVRRRPYSVVLLDEVEKAHPDVHELFFQVFDKGWMEDGEGRLIDFKNTLILLTTNAGTDLIMSLCQDPELRPEPDAIAKELRDPLLKVFPPALLGRLVAIPYYPLNDDMLGKIVVLQLNRIKKRIYENHKIEFNYDEDVIKLIVSRCTETDSGGRMIDAILTNSMLPAMSQEILLRSINGEEIKSLELAVTEEDFKYSWS